MLTWEDYFKQNPDVAQAFQANNYGMNQQDFANTHWQKYGQSEERAAPFDSTSYFQANPDVGTAFRADPMGMDAQGFAEAHYGKYGPDEYRTVSPAQPALTRDGPYQVQLTDPQVENYMNTWGDLIPAWSQSGMSKSDWANQHYNTWGRKEGRAFPWTMGSFHPADETLSKGDTNNQNAWWLDPKAGYWGTDAPKDVLNDPAQWYTLNAKDWAINLNKPVPRGDFLPVDAEAYNTFSTGDALNRLRPDMGLEYLNKNPDVAAAVEAMLKNPSSNPLLGHPLSVGVGMDDQAMRAALAALHYNRYGRGEGRVYSDEAYRDYTSDPYGYSIQSWLADNSPGYSLPGLAPTPPPATQPWTGGEGTSSGSDYNGSSRTINPALAATYAARSSGVPIEQLLAMFGIR